MGVIDGTVLGDCRLSTVGKGGGGVANWKVGAVAASCCCCAVYVECRVCSTEEREAGGVEPEELAGPELLTACA